MTSEAGGPPVARLTLELWREQGHLVTRVRSAEAGQDYGVVTLHELSLLLEAVAADAGDA
jgi:hypothetical protein